MTGNLYRFSADTARWKRILNFLPFSHYQTE